MLASERNLTTAHQSHNQPQRRQQNGVRSRNGTAKPAVRPVKIIVIDPRKLQQRLEAYVGEKERKQAEAEKLSKTDAAAENLQATKNKAENETLPSSSSTPVRVAVPTTLPKALPTSPKPVQTKVLPTLAPKLSGAVQAAVNCTVAVTQAGTVIGNGVTALQCISSGSIGLPIVVTNGVALIQPPISQSSIQPNGIFLPGITAIPNVIATNSAAFIGQATATQVKSKSSTSKKKKVKKRKKAKKRKFSEEDEKEKEAEDAELAYLLKEPTTTRTGRISKPVSQPHSPAFASLQASSGTSSPSSAISSRNSLKVKKKKSRSELAFRCEVCLKVCINQEELKSHFQEFQHHKADQVISQSQYPTSTNDQGTVVPTSQLALRTNINLSQTLNSTTTTITSLSPTVSETSCTLQGSISSALPIGNFQSNNAADSFISFTTTAKTTKRNDFFYPATSSSSNDYQPTKDVVTNVSLVPSSASDEADNLFLHCNSSNVDVVPSSYSIPSSPPSQCQSPGLPENSDGIHPSSKDGSGSPERICNSPVDPMLFRSRSPFPPPIPDCSLQPVSVSNLTIPEESLCKGELFMDLGDGILENMESSRLSQLNVMSISSFCNPSSAPPLYTDASPTSAKRNLQAGQSIGEPCIEEQVASPVSTAHLVTPVLLETTEDANDGEIFQSTNYARKFVHSSIGNANGSMGNIMQQKTATSGSALEFPKTPLSTCIESDASMDSSETVVEHVSHNSSDQKRRNVWQFVKEQIKICGIRQAVGEISEMADKLSRIARDQFIPIREDEMDRMGNSASVIHVDTPFFSHLLDLPFGTYVFKEDAGRRRKVPPPPPLTSSELSFTGGVEDVEKFLPPDIDLISLPHLTNLDLI
ncbi:hypothetical protein Ocin01_12939 [Orchesella cincta]|uniref:C2H2-type domain-containing protein n=1 Tax=Orchesella cincta TaxID=48709 RepID=A0A1D2ML93_ORCCI|nr:hypothetical protein Ocin01_12939 [Orchesella cincta]